MLLMKNEGDAFTAKETSGRLPMVPGLRSTVSVLTLAIATALLLAAGADRTEMSRSDAQSPSSASNTVDPQENNSAFATTVEYVTHFYPLWFSYNQSRLNELVGSSNRMAGPAKMAPVCRFVVASNDDTIYASAFLDLTAGPAILTIPPTRATYSILFVDGYGNIIPVAVGEAGLYALTGPQFSGKLPPDVTRIALPINFPIIDR